MPTVPATTGRPPAREADRLTSLLLFVENADPLGDIVIGIEPPEEGEARFETQPPVDCGIVVGRGQKPEFVAIDPTSLIVSIGAGDHYRGEPIDFSILLTVGTSADLERFQLGAVAAPGTEIGAVLANRPVERFSGGRVELTL